MPGAGLTILHQTPNHVLSALTILVNGTLAVHLTSSLSLGFCSSVWLPTHILHHDHIAFVHFLISFFYDMCSHSPQTPLPQEVRGSMSKGTSIIKCPGIGNLFTPAGQRLSSPTPRYTRWPSRGNLLVPSQAAPTGANLNTSSTR